MNSRTIKNRYDEVTESLACSVTAADYKTLEPKIDNIRKLSRIENRSISLYDINARKFILKEDRHLEKLGYAEHGEIDVNDFDNYHEMVHAGDRDFLFDTEIKTHDYLKGLCGEEKKNHKLVYDYRVRKKNGGYIRFLHQLMVFEVDSAGNSWILMIISDVLSDYADSSNPRRFLLHTKSNEVKLFNRENSIKKSVLTKRESEIANLISQGLDSAEIADRLSISVSTVNNHRQHILVKTTTKNIAQAIAYLKCVGLI